MPVFEGDIPPSEGGGDQTATYYTTPITVAGCLALYVEARATNAETLTTAQVQFANAAGAPDGSWVEASVAGYTVKGALAGADLSLHPERIAVVGLPIFYHEFARLKYIVGANAITGLTTKTRVFI